MERMTPLDRALYLAAWSAAAGWRRAARHHLARAILVVDRALADPWRREVC